MQNLLLTLSIELQAKLKDFNVSNIFVEMGEVNVRSEFDLDPSFIEAIEKEVAANENAKYIVASKENKVFVAACTAFGSIETNVFKNWTVGNCSGATFGTNYATAVNDLHTWIENHPWLLDENKYCDFQITMIDGSLDKNGEVNHKKVYSISKKFIKDFIL